MRRPGAPAVAIVLLAAGCPTPPPPGPPAPYGSEPPAPAEPSPGAGTPPAPGTPLAAPGTMKIVVRSGGSPIAGASVRVVRSADSVLINMREGGQTRSRLEFDTACFVNDAAEKDVIDHLSTPSAPASVVWGDTDARGSLVLDWGEATDGWLIAHVIVAKLGFATEIRNSVARSELALDVELTRALPVRSKVLAGGKPVGGAEIAAFAREADAPGIRPQFLLVEHVVADETGVFQLRGLAPGRKYRLVFISPKDGAIEDGEFELTPDAVEPAYFLKGS